MPVIGTLTTLARYQGATIFTTTHNGQEQSDRQPDRRFSLNTIAKPHPSLFSCVAMLAAIGTAAFLFGSTLAKMKRP